MDVMASGEPVLRPGLRCLLEREVLFLVLLVLATFFSRINAIPLRGEETRRATVAMEMMETGRWIVPRFQGDAFFMSSRPPFHAWAIAACGYLRGDVDAIAVRLPSTIALLTIVLMLYVYCRQFLDRIGALGAAAAYATTIQVLELGRLGESDLLFTLFVSGSLLTWHAGYSLGWPSIRTWTIAYTFVALGTLTKGPQAPVYFAASVGLYLLWKRRPLFAVSLSHAAGILVFLAILGSWQIPFYREMGIAGVRHIYFGDVAMYGNDHSLRAVVTHLIKYPVEILFGCLLPWSIFLLGYSRKELRDRLEGAGDRVAFCLCCIVATFPTVWFVTHARTRFYMPLYPCFAVLTGVVIQRCIESAPGFPLRKFWKIYASVFAVAASGFGLFVLVDSFAELTSLQQPIWLASTFSLFALICGAIIWRVRSGETQRQGTLAIATIAVFIGSIFAIIATNSMQASSIDKSSQMAVLKSQLPASVRLHSIGVVDHSFLFYFRKPIQRCDPQLTTIPDDLDYFCFRLIDFPQPELLPFSWKLISVIACGRIHGESEMGSLTIVGKRTESGPNPDAAEAVRYYKTVFASGPDRL